MFEHLKNKFSFEFDSEIAILPPIFKRYPFFYQLLFPVCNKFDNGFSRPVAIVRVDNMGHARLIKLDFQDFCSDRNFGEKFGFKKDSEFLKCCLDKFFISQPKFCLFKNKNYNEKYLPMLNKLVGDEYFKFYTALMSNDITSTNIPKSFATKDTAPALLPKDEIEKQLSNFVKKEIVPEFFGKSAYVRICFYQNFGELLQKAAKDSDISLSALKFETTKCYAKAMNELSTVDTQTDFLCRLVLICLNTLLIREKGKLEQQYIDEIKDSQKIFNDEISLVKDKKTRENLERIMQNVLKDCTSPTSESAIFLGYKSVFCK